MSMKELSKPWKSFLLIPVSISIRTWIPLILLDSSEHEMDNWTSINIFCDKGTFWIIGS